MTWRWRHEFVRRSRIVARGSATPCAPPRRRTQNRLRAGTPRKSPPGLHRRAPSGHVLQDWNAHAGRVPACPRWNARTTLVHCVRDAQHCVGFSLHRVRLKLAGPLCLKSEINTHEHSAVPDFTKHPFSVESRWRSELTEIATFEFDELLPTKMRTLYQRRIGRNLFDLAVGLADRRSGAGQIVDTLRGYIDREGCPMVHAMIEWNLAAKIGETRFNADMAPCSGPGSIGRHRKRPGRSPGGRSQFFPASR